MTRPIIEVCLLPQTLSNFNPELRKIAVVADILRATTSICAAFDAGADKIIPVATLEQAVFFKNQGMLLAGERGGVKLDFADFGNSPLELRDASLSGKTLALTTTNGTIAINEASKHYRTTIGAFVNLNVLRDWLLVQGENVIIVCAGWESRISLEDTLFAGALVEKLIENNVYELHADEAILSYDIWLRAKCDLLNYISRASHVNRLKGIGEAESIEYCFKTGVSKALPYYQDGALINLHA